MLVMVVMVAALVVVVSGDGVGRRRSGEGNDDVGGSGAADTGDPWGVVLSSRVFFFF